MNDTTALNPIHLEPLPMMFAVRLLTGVPVGETILHKGEIAEVLEVHEHIRQVRVISDLEKEYRWPIWLPRRASDRKQFCAEQKKRALSRKKKADVFRQPCWTGEPRPEAETVDLRDTLPSVADYARLWKLCSENGRPFLRYYLPQSEKNRRQQGRPTQPPTITAEEKKIKLIIGDHAGWSKRMREGVLSVVLGDMRPREAAKLTGEKPATLRKNASRVRQELAKREQSNTYLSG